MIVYDIKVGYSCNNKCVHCVIQDCVTELRSQQKKIDLSFEEVQHLLRSAQKGGAENVVLTGGEISVRKDFPAILDECKKLALGVVVQTNGRRLADPQIVEAVDGYDDISFVVALHGATELTHDKITAVQGSLAESVAGIEAMLLLGRKVYAKVVLSNINMDELPDIVSFCARLGMDEIYVAYPHGQGAARINYKDLAPSYGSLKNILNQAGDVADKSGIPLFFEAVPLCVVPNHRKKVGELSCLNSPESYFVPVDGDVQSWTTVRKDIKAKFKNCDKCLFDNICEGVWGEYVEFFGDDDLQPVVGTKEQQRQMTRIMGR